MFELIRPWLLCLLIPALPVLVWFFVRSLTDFPRRQRIVSLIIRTSIVLLLVLALSGLTWLHATGQQFVIFLIDQSLSVGENGNAFADKFLDDALQGRSDNKVAFLPFAHRALSIQEEREPRKEDASKRPASDEATDKEQADKKQLKQFQDGTDLASAIKAASGYLPPGYVPQLILLTDGNQTTGDALVVAARSRIPISTVPLPARADPEVQVSEVRVPAEVREGEPFYVEVIVHANHEDEGLVEVYRGDHKVISESRKLKTGENSFRFQQSIERDRLVVFSARISHLKQDTLLDNNMDSGLVFAAGKPRVLIIESDPSLIRELAYALEDEGVQVDVRPPQGMPDSLSDLQNYELLMLSNVPATALSGQQMEIARTYVQDLGGGLIMLGGEQSFGLGGYYKSTLEEILPVRSDFEKEQEKPSLGMVLVIDKSGSMGGDKIEMAKSAARSATELLGRRDKVAVLAFDGDTYVISEMQSANNKGKISGEIGRIEAGGGTTMYPAMEMAFEALLATSAKLKHVILLTDGVSSPGDFEGMAQQMVSAKMTLSTVAVGEGSDTDLLEAIARVGKGRYYFTTDPAQVPQIFAKETITASKSAIDEQPFVPQIIRTTHALKSIDIEAAPFLLGYVMTRPKPTSEVILATEKGDPLLSWWRYGLGMSAAFTSDAKSRWAAEWMTWPEFGKFWTQIIRHIMRKSDARRMQIQTARHGRLVSLSVDAVDDFGRFLNEADIALTLIGPQLGQQHSVLKQSAPGRYVAEFETPKSGAYHLEVALERNGQVLYRQSRGLMVGYSDELRIRPPNELLLRSIAETSGGRYDVAPENVFDLPHKTANRPTPLWPYLLTAALLLFVADVALRRIDFSLHWRRPAWAGGN